MSDDSFIREVDDELRQDQMNALWRRYRYYVYGAAAAIIAITGGYRAYEYYSNSQAAASGDAFVAAVELGNDGNHDQAAQALDRLIADGSGQYPMLATLRRASEMANAGDMSGAVAEFDRISSDSGVPEPYQRLAALRAGLLLVDHGTLSDVQSRLTPLAGAGAPFRHSAREGLGLAAWRSGKDEEALRWFTLLVEDQGVPQNTRIRAQILLDLLAGKGVTSLKG